mgnify:CR=1 FL=1
MLVNIIIITSIIHMQTGIIFEFNKDCDISSWLIVNDVVMGGKSSSDFSLGQEGYGEFTGKVSLANNGGFSSLRYRMEGMDIGSYSSFVIRLKGDGKNYQFRAKTSARDYYSYITYINTTGEWQTVEIPFDLLYPNYRGRKLNMDNFPGSYLEEIGFLIGNKKAEEFTLLIKSISLK